MRIDILCGQGSPDGVHLSDVYGQNGRIGVGGAELALLTMCEEWAKAGHEVVLYNNPKRQDGVFEQRMVRDFDKNANRDVLIAFRQPTQKVVGAKGKIVFWSCDQYTIGDFGHFALFCNAVVTISPFHSKYFTEKYEIREAVSIDLPVRVQDYLPAEKVKNRIIFTSVPDRGLWQLAEIFPKVREAIPDASLVITSDYRLWGVNSPNNSQFVQKFLRQENVQFLGAIDRKRLVEEQAKAQIHLYPGVYEELFCIAVAESQVAGVIPITTPIGALETTNMGVVINGNADDHEVKKSFVQNAVKYLQDSNLPEMQRNIREIALQRFSPEVILKQWDEKVFNVG